MLTEFLAHMVVLVVSPIVAGLEDVVHPDLFEYVADFAEQLGHLLSFGPASAIGVLVVTYYAVDLFLNAYTFAITTYRLIPAKAT